MDVLVTGSRGFLGRFLCKHLVSKGENVTALHSENADLTKENSLSPWDQKRFDVIYHLAAWTQAGDFCLYHPGEQWIINQKINTNLLSWWSKNQPQAKLVCMGTSCAYDPNYSLEEKNYLLGVPIDSLFSYAMAKRMLLCGLISLQKQYGLNYLYLIPSTLYGPDYHKDGRQMHFIFDLIRKILKGKLFNTPVVLWGDGEQKRELIHVEDFLSALIPLVESQNNQWINIGSGKEFSIKEFAKKICKQVGFPFENIQFDTQKYVGSRSKVLNVDLLQNILPNWKTRSLDQGLGETIDWFFSHKDELLQ